MSNKLLDQNGVETLIELVKQKLKHQNEDCYTKDEVNALLNRKQNKLTIDGTLTSNSLNPVTSKGIYQEVAKKVNSSAIASVATSGDYNDLKNKPAIPTKVSELQQDVPETDPTVPSWAKQPNKPSYTYDEITNKPTIPDTSTLATKSELANFCPIIEDTRASAVATITGVAPFATLTDKQRITIRLAKDTGNYTKVNLTLSGGTETGEIPVYAKTYNTGISLISSQNFLAGTCMELLYTASTNRWMCLNLDRDTTTWKMSQNEINNATDTDARAVPTAKLLRDNFYLESEVDSLITNYNPLIVEGTRNGSMLTGNAPFAQLNDKQRITLWPNANIGTFTTLNLTLSDGTTTGAIPVWRQSANGNVGQLSYSYWKDCPFEIMYDATNNRWITVGQADTNTTYTTMTQTHIDTSATYLSVVSAKLLRDNFYLKSEAMAKRTLVTTGSALTATTYVDLGTTDTIAPTLPASPSRADEFVFTFTCQSAAPNITLPQGVALADGFDWSEADAGVQFQVSIQDGIAAYLVLTPNS